MTLQKHLFCALYHVLVTMHLSILFHTYLIPTILPIIFHS